MFVPPEAHVAPLLHGATGWLCVRKLIRWRTGFGESN